MGKIAKGKKQANKKNNRKGNISKKMLLLIIKK